MLSSTTQARESVADSGHVGQPTSGRSVHCPDVPIAVLTFDFDPYLRLGSDLALRWQTLALAVVIAAVLVAAGLAARRVGLRADDLLSIVIGAVPGAVVSGRLAFALTHPATLGWDPARLLDPALGGIDLAAAVVGGIASGAFIAGLLGAPIGRWAHVAAVPLLVAIGAGKLTMVLGGSGQGLPDEAAWATAYGGAGPWGSLAAALPSHPAQAYEGLATLLLATLLALALAGGAFARRDGRALAFAVVGWALIRASVAVTWRDPVAPAPLGTTGWVAIIVAISAVAVLVLATIGALRTTGTTARAEDDLSWPDPESRPRF